MQATAIVFSLMYFVHYLASYLHSQRVTCESTSQGRMTHNFVATPNNFIRSLIESKGCILVWSRSKIYQKYLILNSFGRHAIDNEVRTLSTGFSYQDRKHIPIHSSMKNVCSTKHQTTCNCKTWWHWGHWFTLISYQSIVTYNNHVILILLSVPTAGLELITNREDELSDDL